MPHAQKQSPASVNEKEDQVLAEKKEKHIKRRSKILSDDDVPLANDAPSPVSDTSQLPSPGGKPSPRKNQNRHSFVATEDDEFSAKSVKKCCCVSCQNFLKTLPCCHFCFSLRVGSYMPLHN